MAIVCIHGTTDRSLISQAVGILLALSVLVSGKLMAGPPPTDAECDTALTAGGIAETQQLNFGTILADAFGGTVTVTYKGVRSSNGPILLGATSLPGIFTSNTGAFNCSNKSPTVTLVGGNLDRVGGGTTPLTLQNLQFSTKAASPSNQYNTGTFYVGGDLVIPASPQDGVYSGNYSITVTFP